MIAEERQFERHVRDSRAALKSARFHAMEGGSPLTAASELRELIKAAQRAIELLESDEWPDALDEGIR